MKLTSKHLMKTLLAAALCSSSASVSAFTVNHIRFEGLQRVRPETVRNYLTIKEGKEVDPRDTRKLVEDLYKTGFFEDISLARSNTTLIIRVVERSVISRLNITGNHEIKTEDLMKVLKENGIGEGRTYDKSVFTNIQHSLEGQYFNLGRYNAKVHTKITRLQDNRVDINISIFEGQVSKIKDIRVVGNQTFSSKSLLKDFQLSTTSLFSFISHNDRYAADKLAADLESLRSYYMDRGYLEFQITSTQVTITPDKRDVFITINVKEGKPFILKTYSISTKLTSEIPQLRQLIKMDVGKPFSRKELIDSQKRIVDYFADKGFAFAKVNIQPDVNEKTHEVSVNLDIVPGQRVYVRNVTFDGNTSTKDEVIRRELRQFESSLYSQANVKEGKRRLANLGYLEKVDVDTKPVPGSSNLVDVSYKVTEAPAASANAQIGYSDAVGFVYGANIKHKNFMGTGNSVMLGFEKNDASQNYSFDIYKPYLTISGIGAGFTAYYQKTTPGHVGISNYRMDSYGGSVNFSVPISEYNHFSFGLGYSNIDLMVDHGKCKENQTVYEKFVHEKGNIFDQFTLSMGWSHSSYDRAIFPTEGFRHSLKLNLGVPVAKDSLQYYKVNYDASYYHPLPAHFVFNAKARLGYGDGFGSTSTLPFFLNYYAGGMDTVRSFDDNSLGPIDVNHETIGGNILTTGSLELIMPEWFGEHIRTLLYFDAGNVFDSHFHLKRVDCDNPQKVLAERDFQFDPSRLHYSAGVHLEWLSPFGPLRFSVGYPLNKVTGDFNRPRIFQFSVGTSL
ncbi:MAG: outer membrane protein assembly factor BamA [Gammaproteobacteria bacterium]|nr:outer membrane protein assembly factor BamA [Gammaproteobacteria bacterium]